MLDLSIDLIRSRWEKEGKITNLPEYQPFLVFHIKYVENLDKVVTPEQWAKFKRSFREEGFCIHDVDSDIVKEYDKVVLQYGHLAYDGMIVDFAQTATFMCKCYEYINNECNSIPWKKIDQYVIAEC